MTSFAREPEVASCTGQSLASMIAAIPPGRRGSVLQQVAAFQGTPAGLDQEFRIGPIRAAFADYWEGRFNSPVPIRELRQLLEPPVPIATVLKFSGLLLARELTEIEAALVEIVDGRWRRLIACQRTPSGPPRRPCCPES